MQRWLMVYFVETHEGPMRSKLEPKTAMITAQGTDLPFGVDWGALDLGEYAAKSPFVLIEMPDDSFRPMVVDVRADDEVEMTFIDR